MARNDETVRFEHLLRSGNDLFARAVLALGNPIGSVVMRDTVRALGTVPEALTIDELGAALPEIERRIRTVLSPSASGDALARLRTLILHWDEPAGDDRP